MTAGRRENQYAFGPAGPNGAYLNYTAAHLIEMGVRDAELEKLDRLVGAALDCRGVAVSGGG